MNEEFPLVLRFIGDIWFWDFVALDIGVDGFVPNGENFSEALLCFAIGSWTTNVDFTTNGDCLRMA